jgi:hypothetical protein
VLDPGDFSEGLPMKTRLSNGALSGLAGAAASGAIALLASGSGLSPQFNPPDLLARLMNTTPDAVVGWGAHLLVYGLGLGLLFGALGRKLSDLGYTLSGLFFALFTYGAAGLLFMPMAGAGVFGMNLGYATVPVMLVAHLAFGLTLGRVYAALAGRDRDALVTPA